MSDAPELLPCPFCGSQPEIDVWEVGNYGDQEAGVICRSCGAAHAGAIEFGAGEQDVQAMQVNHAAAWNRRATPAKRRGGGVMTLLLAWIDAKYKAGFTALYLAAFLIDMTILGALL